MTVATFTANDTFAVETCANCGIRFGMPLAVQQQRREDGKSFFCPTGHSQHYTETEIQKLQKQLDAKQAALVRQEAETTRQRELREHEERSHAATRGLNTKLKKRINAGVCPCCTKVFKDLQEHMRVDHPGWRKS